MSSSHSPSYPLTRLSGDHAVANVGFTVVGAFALTAVDALLTHPVAEYLHCDADLARRSPAPLRFFEILRIATSPVSARTVLVSLFFHGTPPSRSVRPSGGCSGSAVSGRGAERFVLPMH